MSEIVPSDRCETCDAPYDITSTNAKLYCFLEYPRANHIEVICPVGHEENIFVGSDGFMQVLQLCKLTVVFGLNPSDDFKDACDNTFDGLQEPEEPELPDAPNWMTREIYDDCRNWRGVIDGIVP